jgi:diguanylate cyclase
MTLTLPERLRHPSPSHGGRGPVPELQQLARLIGGEPRDVLRRLLLLVCEQLAMDVAVVCTLGPGGRRTVRMTVRADGTAVEEVEGTSAPLPTTWCGHVLEASPLLVADVRLHPELEDLPATAEFWIRSFAGVALRDAGGAVIGTLAAIGHGPHRSLNARDGEVLRGLGEVVVPLLPGLAGTLPAPRAAPALSSIADAVTGARDVEQLSRPLLDALHDLTGLASSYLTVIHEERDEQEIRYSRNTRPGFALPEGLHVPWADTLCKRALDEGRPCTTDVPGLWGDSEAAIALGIQVYVSVPVALSDGRVWGTLCAADSESAEQVDAHLPTMRLFARLIAAQVEQEHAVAAERERADQARAEAATDPLTGCATRRVVEPWLADALATAGPDEVVVAVYADLDAFKAVNDELGHAAGDAVLAEVARRMQAAARPGDLVARLGGDEFLAAATVPRQAAPALAERYREALRFELAWEGRLLAVAASVGCAVSERHDAAGLVAAADAAMYAVKRGYTRTIVSSS